MTAPVVRVDGANPDPSVVAQAAGVLRSGGLVAIPTETVYGLAANALDPVAVRRIYEAKGRPAFNPLIVHLADAGDLPRVVRDIPPLARALVARFWPGPLTLVMHRQPVVPDEVTAGLDTVAVRVPALGVTRAVIREARVPIAAPSANLFTRVSPTTAQHVASQLGHLVDLILDAGPTSVGIESTVLDLTTTPPRLLRPGGIARTALEGMTGPLTEVTVAGEAPRPAPGMIDRHYAPRTSLRLFAARDRAAVEREAASRRAAGQSVCMVVRSDEAADAAGVRHMPTSPEPYARALYRMLHELDDAGIAFAFVEEVPSGAAWDAVRDRLMRASTAA